MDIRTLLLVNTFLILVIFLRSLNSQKCSSEEFHTGINTTTSCYHEYSQCSFAALQSAHPSLYTRMDTWKQPNVTDFKLTSFCKLDADGINQSGLNMQWKLQDVSGSEDIKGFEVRVEGSYRGDFRCVVMTLNENITRDKINEVFTGMVKVARRTTNRVIIISLPRTEHSSLPHKDIRSIDCDRGKSSDSWVLNTCNKKYDSDKQTLNVTFEEPPKVYNITAFSLDIFSQRIDFFKHKISNSTHVVFNNVKPGNYSINMQPYDPYRHDKDRCVCRDDEDRCSPCVLSQCNIEIKKTKQTQVDSVAKVFLVALIPSVLVVLGIILFVKLIAPRCGIDLGYCFGTSDKPNLLCIDASGSSDMATTFKKLIHREFKYCHRSTIKYRHVTYCSDTCNNFGQLIMELSTYTRRNTIGSDLCCKKYQGVDQNKYKKAVVCLLVKDLLQKSTSDIYCKLHIEMAKLPEVHCDWIVVYSVCGSHHTVDKSFKLSDEKSLISGIKNAIENISTFPDEHQSIEDNLADTDFPNTIALPEVKLTYDTHAEYYSRPENNHLCIHANEKRGRYLSNDSGHGASPKDWNGSFNAIYEDYAASSDGQHLVATSEVQHCPYEQRGRYMSNDSGHGTSHEKWNETHDEYVALRRGQHLVNSAGVQILPYEQRCNLDNVSWTAPSISVDDLDTCGYSITMDSIANEMLSINEDARTVLQGSA